MTTTEARLDLADRVATGMPGWSVYAEPPDTVHAPAIAIGPGDPYREATAYRQDTVRLRLVVLLSAGMAGPLSRLDAALDELLPVLRGAPYAAIDRVGQVGQLQEVAGVGYLSAVVDLTLGIERV